MILTVAFTLAVPGILMSNPSTAGQQTAAVRGVLRITRHPFLRGMAIWAGRNHFVASEYFDWRFTVAVVEIALLLYFHNYLFSMSPFPNNWLPS